MLCFITYHLVHYNHLISFLYVKNQEVGWMVGEGGSGLGLGMFQVGFTQGRTRVDRVPAHIEV